MPARKPRPAIEPALIVELRAAIADAGVNCYALAKKAGVDEASVRRFVGRRSSLGLDSAARLCDALGLRLARPSKPRKFAGAPPRTTSEPAEKFHGETFPPADDLAE